MSFLDAVAGALPNIFIVVLFAAWLLAILAETDPR